MSEQAMPFGKYEGCYFDEIPTDYLEYIVDNFDSGWILDAAEEELHQREEDESFSF